MSRRAVVHLIDGHIYIFRAYFSLPEMRAPDGTPTGAAYGFTNTLLRYLERNRPSHAAVVFDYALTSFRNQLEPGYKADRTDAPPDLEPQFELCAQAARALGVATFESEGFEADDLIATLAEQLMRRGARVVIASSDKDLAQLVSEDGRAVLHDPAKDTTLDADGVRAKFGVSPAQIPDYLGLVGDAVDNLPGVPGVGPKSTAAVLAAFGSIEKIPPDPEAWAGVAVRGGARLAGRIAEHRERALRTRELATVVRDVPGVRGRLADLAVAGPDRKRVAAMCERLGWERLRRRILP